jgi:5-formyltetrahydrofolate cyclo-ligase
MSRQIIEALIALPLYQEKTLFFIYCSYRSEVETGPLLKRCLQEGKTVFVPKSVPEQSGLLAVAITNPVTDLLPGFRGIPEPVPSLAERPLLHPQSIEVSVIPGAVFARSGHRLGYGGGYYDRFLAQEAPRSYRIGLAFSVQLVEQIPVLPHDVPMDMLITEKEILLFPGICNQKNRCL